MIPAVKRNSVQFSRPGQTPEPDGLSGERIFSDSECKEAGSEKNRHTPSQSQGDPLKDTSDSSVSSYHTALCSEGAESFKDCVESLEDEGDTLLTQPPDGDPDDESDLHRKNKTASVSLSERSPAGMKDFWRGASEDTVKQLCGTPSDFDKAAWELPDKNSKGAGDICAAASTAIVHSALNRSQASGGSLTTTAERTFSTQAGRECAASNQVCRYRGYLSAKEKQQVQMSITGPAKNSSAPGYSSRMGLATRELQPGAGRSKYLDPPLRFNAPKPREMFLKAHNTKGSRAPVISKAPCPQYCADNSSTGSDSEEADNEVQKLTALSFRSLSCPHGSSLCMYSSSNRTSSSLSNSLSEDSNGMNRWSMRNELRKAEVVSQAKGSRQFPAASQVPEKDPPSYSFGKDPFECVDVVLESAAGKKGHSKKRTVPKRQIQLKQRDRNEMSFLGAGDCAAHQPFAAPRNDTCPKGRTISSEFRINYKQFMRTASLDDSYSKTRMASCLVKNVLAKKMQYEQRIRMEQKSMQGSSTSSVPSSVSTDLVGDFTERKSSSLSKSDCSCSAEDLQSHSMSERSESMSQESTDAMRPTKGVVLNEQQRENVCKLKKTFNELDERLKSHEATQSKPLPILADGMNRDSGDRKKQVAKERKEYWRARALFESKQAEVKGSGVAPTFSKAQKPWPSLKQRAITKNKHTSWEEEKVPFKPKSLVVARDPARNIFMSTTQEMKLIPQSKPEQQQKMLNVSRQLTQEGGAEKRPAAVQSTKYSSLILPTSCRSRSDGKSTPPEASHTQEAKKTESKGRRQIHQPRDVRKLVKNTYSLCFKSSDIFNRDQETNSGDSISLAASPLFIHCTSVCRKDDVQTKTHSHGKNWEQQLNLDVSALSIPDQRTSDLQHSATLNPTTKPYVDGPVSLTESKCTAVSESPIHITQIQSKKKVVAGNEEPQLKPENKSVCYKRSELNVTPCSKATRKAPQMESQLNVKVNSSLSKHPHRTQADHFPAPAYSALDGRAPKDSSTQANCSSLEKSKAVLFPSSTSPKDSKNDTYINRNTARPGHFQEAQAQKEPEWPFQKHLSTEIISLTHHDSQDFSVSPKEENNVSEQTKEGYRHLQPIKPTGTSTQTSHTNTPANNQSVNGSYQRKAQNKMFDAPRPLDSQVFVPATLMSPECANSNAFLRSKEYSEETRLPGVPSAAPSPPAGKLQDQRENWDHLNRQQAGNEQYFTATHAENANYLTIPVKAQKPEAAPKPLVPSHSDHTLVSSNVFLQQGGEAPVSTISNESPQLKAPEGKAAAEHSMNDQPSHVQPHHRVNDSPNFLRRNNGVSPGSRSAPSPTRSFAPQPQAHRKMLIDPDSGKCYYMEPPRQPQLKMLFDPETGQYLEVLIPPVPLASHSRLYPSPFNPLVMNPGVYGPPYIPYPGFPGFPPPPVAMPSVHPNLPNQQPCQENTNVTETFSPGPKGEAPPATQATDCNYMESLYYIPTGMNSSPSPNQPLFSPATSSNPSMPEKGPLFRM
ncbi:uncharacterized protein LOC115656509 isoform X1 [Gopherus evgoodei]|uniref:uncharacterized protein LOC115656509 isoform X1 n=1 Tax=Gopherus evgoodei TaxID=1825980 RepID=UPI0011D00F46|nr:uncharacterized protein LOC115656509 isoform X1 [Gopherus evgoodei]